MGESTIKFTSFPRTEPPPGFVCQIVEVFKSSEDAIATQVLNKHLKSDEVLRIVGPGLATLGFAVETGKKKKDKIERPVFYGENGNPILRFEVDAYHEEWKCGLEVEATRAIRGGAVYRDLIQALVMVHVDHLCLAVPNMVRWGKADRLSRSKCYDETIHTAEALYGHSRISFPYALTVIGY